MDDPMRPFADNMYQVSTPRWRRLFPVYSAAVVTLTLVVIFVAISQRQQASSPSGPVPSSVINGITNISPVVFDAVGTGGLRDPLVGLPAGSALTSDGKPVVFYVGAEYCPYCAAERWSVIIALSRFGTWSNLRTTSSADTDAFPDTPTFTFDGATYASQYLVFDGKEAYDRNAQPLQTLTASEQTIFTTYDAPPYTQSQNAGGIPFIYFGGRYMTLSSGYSPALLHASQDPGSTPLTYQQIVAGLSNPTDPVAKAIIGNANYLTAAICTLTGGRPAGVCGSSAIRQIEAKLPK